MILPTIKIFLIQQPIGKTRYSQITHPPNTYANDTSTYLRTNNIRASHITRRGHAETQSHLTEDPSTAALEAGGCCIPTHPLKCTRGPGTRGRMKIGGAHTALHSDTRTKNTPRLPAFPVRYAPWTGTIPRTDLPKRLPGPTASYRPGAAHPKPQI